MVIPNIEFATKYLMPKRGAEIIPRRRLLDVLHSNIGIRSQTLTAPAGYGKTTLLVDFANEIEIPVCWYFLDKSDQDPRLLIEGILSSIRFHFAEFGQLTQSRLSASKDLTKEAPQIVGVLTGEMYASLPLVSADEDRLQQIIINLLDNAFKFTPEGGVITLKAMGKDSNLIIEVHDTGLGIDKDEQQRLFQPYYRLESDRERLSGLGLGLALSKTLVELHQGEIWIKSQRDRGNTFGFSIPLAVTAS